MTLLTQAFKSLPQRSEVALLTTKGKSPPFNKLSSAVGTTYFMSASIIHTFCISTGINKEK